MKQKIDEELRFHVEQSMAKNLAAGMSPEEEAREAALRQFGWTESIKETCREQCGVLWVESLCRDVRYAARMLLKTPGFSAIAIVTLALGIGVNLALFTLLDDEFLRPRQVAHPEEVWSLVPADSTGKPRFFNFSTPYYEAIRKNNRVFAQIGDIFRCSPKHRTADGYEEINGNIVSANYFELIGSYPTLGRGFLPEEDLDGCTPVAIISYDFWQENFGGKLDVLGKTLDLDDHSFQIIGVTPPGFLGLGTHGFKFIIPDGTARLFYPWPLHDTIVRLKYGLSPSVAADSMAPIVQEVTKALHPIVYSVLETPTEAGNNSDFTRVALLKAGYGTADRHFAYEDRARIIQVNSLAALGTLLVLLIAAGNLANLLLARGLRRRRELATRIALGATRWTIIRQLTLEGAILSSLGVLAALAMLKWFGQAAPSLMSAVVYNPWKPIDFQPDLRVVAFAAATGLIIGVGFSLPPAFAATGFAPFAALKDSGLGSWGRRWSMRTALVVGQVAGSLVFLSSVFLCLRAINAQIHNNIGFAPNPILMASPNLEQAGFTTDTAPSMCQALITAFSGLPGVQAVGMVDRGPFLGERGSLLTDRVRLHEGVAVGHATVDVGPGYFNAMGIPLVAGREVSESDFASGRAVAMLNETFVRTFWPNQSVLGWPVQKVRGETFEVIGIVRDARLDSPAKPARPTVYYRADIHDALHPTFILRANNPNPLIPLIRSELVRIHPLLRKSAIHTMPDAMLRPLNPQRKVMNLLAEIAIVALGLTALGAYGVVSFLVTQRTNEFGVRLAVGAGRTDILRLILKLGLGLAVAGTALGLPVAFGGSFLLRHLVPGVSPLDLLSFGIAAGAIVIAILFACYLPARRASRVDPMTALRYE